MKPKYNSGAFRYSNASAVDMGLFKQIEGSDDKTDLPENYYSTTSSGSSFDWGQFFTDLLGIGNTFVSSYWNKGDSYRADAYEQMLVNEKRTNTILWVVIGLVVALGVFLVIRKNK